MHSLLLFIMFQAFISIAKSSESEENKHILDFHIDPSKNVDFIPSNETNQNIPEDWSLSSNGVNNINDLEEYLRYLKKQGVKTLENTGDQILKEINVTKTILEVISTVTKDYKSKLQIYFEYITSGGSTAFFFDEEFIFLNLFDTASKLLYREQWKLLNDIIKDISKSDDDPIVKVNATNDHDSIVEVISTDNKLIDRIRNISDSIIYKQSISARKDEIQYACLKYDICRPYPAFTDYCENFLNEILRLPNDKFKTVVDIFKKSVNSNDDFLAMISEIHGNKSFIKEIEILCRNNSVKDSLIVVRTVLNQRFKILHTPVISVRNSMQAARILLDILDRALYYNTDYNFILDFDTTIEFIKSWAIGQKSLHETAIKKLVNNLFKILRTMKFSVTPLFEVIVRGGSNHEALDATLFMEGSKGVYAFA